MKIYSYRFTLAYVRSMPLRECLCSEFSLAQQNKTKVGLGPILAGQRGSAHKERMKISGFIREEEQKAAQDATR